MDALSSDVNKSPMVCRFLFVSEVRSKEVKKMTLTLQKEYYFPSSVEIYARRVRTSQIIYVSVAHAGN